MLWGLAALNTQPSKFWSVTLQPLGAGQTTIQKLKGDINSFHRRYKGFIYYKRLQSYKVHKPLVQSLLVNPPLDLVNNVPPQVYADFLRLL